MQEYTFVFKYVKINCITSMMYYVSKNAPFFSLVCKYKHLQNVSSECLDAISEQ